MGKSIVAGLMIAVSVIIGSCIIAHSMSLNGRYTFHETRDAGTLLLDTRTGHVWNKDGIHTDWRDWENPTKRKY